MHEVSRETYDALEVLGEAVVRELACAVERARRLHPVFALTPAEAAAVVYNEASELVASVHDRESPDRQHAEAVDTVVTGLRFMGLEWMPRFGSERPAPASEAVETHFDSDDDFEGVSEAPASEFWLEDAGDGKLRVRVLRGGVRELAAAKFFPDGEAPETLYERLDAAVRKSIPLSEAPDVVNHPPHYTAGGIECIDAIKAALTPEEFAGYCKGNLMKYSWRERHKGGLESLKKGRWYLQKLIDNYPGGPIDATVQV